MRAKVDLTLSRESFEGFEHVARRYGWQDGGFVVSALGAVLATAYAEAEKPATEDLVELFRQLLEAFEANDEALRDRFLRPPFDCGATRTLHYREE